MSNSSASPSAVGGSTPVNDEAASTITVNTKTPSNPFPPPKTDKPRPHVCGTCQRSFARLEHLKRHERSHTKEKPFECPECSRCFARRDLLLRHQQKLHQTTTPSSRPRNRRESTSSVAPGASRMRKNSVAGPVGAAAATSGSSSSAPGTSMRPRANTISHVDVQMLSAANHPSRMPPTHSRHPSLAGLPLHHHNNSLDHHHHAFAGMASALGQRGISHGLPKLETQTMGIDFSAGLRTAPAVNFAPDVDFESLLFGTPTGSTINPNALHYNDSPQSMALDPMSPFPHGLPDMSAGGGQQQQNQPLDDGFDWLTGFEHQMSFSNANGGANENAVDESSPSAISTTSQSGISDVMLDGSNHPSTSAATSSLWQPTSMAPPQMPPPFSLDLGTSVFPDLLNGAPVSPQPQPQQQQQQQKNYFSTPPPSLSSLSPSVLPGLGSQNLNRALGAFGAGPETPSSINGSSHGTLTVSTITDSTRNAILGALSTCPQKMPPLPTSAFSPAPTSPLSPQQSSVPSSSPANSSDGGSSSGLPSTQDLQRYVAAYLRYFHPHLPFLHLPTLSFEQQQQQQQEQSGCLVLSMAAIGALYDGDQQASRDLFGMAKKMIQLYLDERRKANVRKADFCRVPGSDPSAVPDTPVWLVQAMLLNVVYGHNCGDKRAGEIASTHAAALVSLAQGAELLRPARVDHDVQMDDCWTDSEGEWLRWKAMEERKRTLYAIFIMSSLLVSAFNHTPALTNSEVLLDLPCDEEFFAAESAAVFGARGGAAAANHNRMTFHEALGDLLRASERLPALKPSTFGCLVLINALHNYIWETRQRHHNKAWTAEETDKMQRHIEPALKAWQAAWASHPQHSAQRPNPYGQGPLSADAVPLLDLAYVRLFVDLSRSRDKFWQRDWDAMAEAMEGDAGENMGNKPSVPDLVSPLPPPPPPPPPPDAFSFPLSPTRSISRRELHLRKAAFYAADSLSMADKLGATFADAASRDLPLSAALCAFDCAQVLAEWVATLQDRVGRYLGVLGQDEVDPTQVPGIMLLEDDDARLLAKMQEVVGAAELKMGGDSQAMDGHSGFAAKILRATAYTLDKAAVWPVTRLMAIALEAHANHMRARAERSVMAAE